MPEPRLLDVRDLTVSFDTRAGTVEAVRGISFAAEKGKTLAIVGESGSGKSVSVQALLGLTRGARVGGTALFDGSDLLRMNMTALRAIRGAKISMVFQDPQTSLHPLLTVGSQIAEALRVHTPMSARDARARAVELLGVVGIPEPARRADEHAHQFSGGMVQRAMIAMAIAHNPRVIIADEPTTALDPTVQAQIIELLRKLQVEFGTALILITHDLGVVAECADDVVVMHGGRVVEHTTRQTLFRGPREPYTEELFRSLPRVDLPSERGPAKEQPVNRDVLVRVERVVKHYPARSLQWLGGRGAVVHAVEDVTLDIGRGETLGLVGETGCGKSTLARCIMRLVDVTSGRVVFDGNDITQLSRDAMRPFRRRMQVVFQDAAGSLNPRRRIGDIIGDPLEIHGEGTPSERARRVTELMEVVGLDPDQRERYPSEFSGGQRQRIGIARAVALRPDLVVCDEPVSALDVSIRAQILDLLANLQRTFGLTYVFISHDLAVVRHVCDRVAVMYLGKIVEVAPVEHLFAHPRHPYTTALLSAVPVPDPDASSRARRIVLAGDPPSPVAPPSGCRFHPRCPRAQARCASEEPVLESRLGDSAEHRAACHFPVDA